MLPAYNAMATSQHAARAQNSSSKMEERVNSPALTLALVAALTWRAAVDLANALLRCSGVNFGGIGTGELYAIAVRISSAIDRAFAVIASAPSAQDFVIGLPITT